MALGLRRVLRKLALTFPPVWPSRCKHTVGTRIAFFEAQFPARRCLCLRFTRPLTAPSARLVVRMVRYSFPVGLFHPRLHAGLSRRLRFLTRAVRSEGIYRATTVRECSDLLQTPVCNPFTHTACSRARFGRVCCGSERVCCGSERVCCGSEGGVIWRRGTCPGPYSPQPSPDCAPSRNRPSSATGLCAR